jgi:hypothetical protein
MKDSRKKRAYSKFLDARGPHERPVAAIDGKSQRQRRAAFEAGIAQAERIAYDDLETGGTFARQQLILAWKSAWN